MTTYSLVEQNDTWSILNPDGSIYLNSQDYKAYLKTWSLSLRDGLVQPNSSVLLVNDSSQIMYNGLAGAYSVTIVDPLAYTFTEQPFKSVLNTVPFRNAVDSLGLSHKLVLLDTTFSDAYVDGCFTQRFSAIAVNVRSVEDISVEQIERYFLLLEDYGSLFIQVSSDLPQEETKLTLDHYFSVLNSKLRTSTACGTIQVFNSYLKISNLV